MEHAIGSLRIEMGMSEIGISRYTCETSSSKVKGKKEYKDPSDNFVPSQAYVGKVEKKTWTLFPQMAKSKVKGSIISPPSVVG